MHSVLVVSTPAPDRSLLTQAERREAVGVTDSSQDARLAALDLRLGAAIMAECNIAIGAGAEPTLLQETLTETCRRVDAAVMVLARRHNVEITSLIEDGVMLTSEVSFTVDPESGLVTRLDDDCPRRWCAGKVVVVYKAGFVTVPGDLKMAAMDFMRLAWAEGKRDPALKSQRTDIPGVMEKEVTYWVGSVPGQSNEGAVPDIVSGQLTRFRNVMVA
ncbi:hypothetical protein EOD08_06790 [Mesorhizobium sp. M6A.T.Ca.TU.002.02.2.1]|nr:hypothetical protein EOD08_06790 [Mesorhizobium sp. M6A.T.Ca.TU.002.02.2.1]